MAQEILPNLRTHTELYEGGLGVLNSSALDVLSVPRAPGSTGGYKSRPRVPETIIKQEVPSRVKAEYSKRRTIKEALLKMPVHEKGTAGPQVEKRACTEAGPSPAAKKAKVHAGDVQAVIAVLHCNEKKATQLLGDCNSNVHLAIELGLAQDSSNEECLKKIAQGHEGKEDLYAYDSPKKPKVQVIDLCDSSPDASTPEQKSTKAKSPRPMGMADLFAREERKATGAALSMQELEGHLKEAYAKDHRAESVVTWMKRRPGFNKKSAVAALEVVVDAAKSQHTKEQRGVHSLAQQCMLVLIAMPGRTLTPSTPPDRKSDPFVQTFMPMYKERKMQGLSETRAKGGAAALQTVASMMEESAFFTDHKNRVIENAVKKAKAGEGSKQPPVVSIHAAATVFGAQAKLNTDTGAQEVPMMVLCEWEGCGSSDIDDDQMTWQPEEHFYSDFLRRNLNVLVDFKRWYQDCTKVEDRALTWPLSKAMRKEVVCKPSFQWVENHPSLKKRLKFKA